MLATAQVQGPAVRSAFRRVSPLCRSTPSPDPSRHDDVTMQGINELSTALQCNCDFEQQMRVASVGRCTRGNRPGQARFLQSVTLVLLQGLHHCCVGPRCHPASCFSLRSGPSWRRLPFALSGDPRRLISRGRQSACRGRWVRASGRLPCVMMSVWVLARHDVFIVYAGSEQDPLWDHCVNICWSIPRVS